MLARSHNRATLPFMLVVLLALLATPTHAAPQPIRGPATAEPLATNQRRHYLPNIQRPVAFANALPIWVATATQQPLVSLFRYRFSLNTPLTNTTLALFADTRYDVWLDGIWQGRGPARFAQGNREYDIYPTGTLASGSHTIAVLVQWAPNTRRSESVAPFLRASLDGTARAGRTVVAATGPAWKALASSAWRSDAALVHRWHLIGPTELLDLRKLPANWAQPGFDDSAWPAALVTNTTAASYQPRSIPPMALIPQAASVREVGRLAAGRTSIEIGPTDAGTTINFSAERDTTLLLETLLQPEQPISSTILLDGVQVSWNSQPARPGVAVTNQPLAQGDHWLTLVGPLSSGMSLAMGGAGLALPPGLFNPGPNAGRRLLLAEPQPVPDAVQVGGGPALDLTFRAAPAYAVLDLGRIAHGRVVAEVTGPAGAIVDIGWDERLWQNSRPLPFPGALHPEWNQTDSWVLDGQTRSITTIDSRTGRYLLIAVWGGANVRLSQLRVVEERYPTTQQGVFSSSDPQLNRIWQVGVDTLRINMLDAYADPWRERGQWWGDAFIADRVNQVAFGDRQLVMRGLRLMAAAIGPDGRPHALAPNGAGNYLLDYGMLWVQSLHDYLRQSGDTRLVAQLYPTVVRFVLHLKRFQNQQTGLLDLSPGPWSETSYIDPPAAYNRYGQSTALNAMYYRMLLNAADLAQHTGDTALADGWRRQAAGVKQQINTILYLPTEGRYLATIVGGERLPPSPHAQAWALAYDLVPPAEQAAVADALLELLSNDPAAPNVETYGMFWVLEALGRSGRITSALAIIKTYYGRMLDLGATSWWEKFNAHQSYTAALSHGWGSSPTWFLTSYVAGARRTSATTWVVRPALRSLPAAEAWLPFNAGQLGVRWRSPTCGKQLVDISAPPGTSGELLVPFDDPGLSVLVDQQPFWQAGKPQSEHASLQGKGIALKLGAGQHQVELQTPCTQP